MIRAVVLSVGAFALAQPAVAQDTARAKLDALIASAARANNVPVALVHRVIVRESRYRPNVVGKQGALGLMQIKLATARGLGYTGTAKGLLDPETNLTYAVKYLAGAYRVADGNADRAVMHYARGYYYAAKRKGMLDDLSAQARLGGASSAHAAPTVARAVAAQAKASGFDVFSHRDQIVD